MKYVDGFVIPVAKSKIKAYVKLARWARRTWMKHGALQFFECVGDDLNQMPRCGDFTKMVKRKPSETVFFSFIVYKSKAHRDAVNKRVMAEMEKNKDKAPKSLPFSTQRMAYGGFKALVEG